MALLFEAKNIYGDKAKDSYCKRSQHKNSDFLMPVDKISDGGILSFVYHHLRPDLALRNMRG